MNIKKHHHYWYYIGILLITTLVVFMPVSQNSTFAAEQLTEGTPENTANQNQGGQGRIKRVKSTMDELILETDIEDLSLIENDVDGLVFSQLSLPNSGFTTEVGKPELPTFGQFFAVPNGAEMQVEVLEAEYETIQNVLVYPAQEPQPDCATVSQDGQETGPFAYDADFYGQEGVYPDQVVTVDPVTSIRGVHASIAHFYPVQYNPALQELTVYSYIKVRISFTGGSRSVGDLSKRSEAFENIYSNLLINFDSLEEVDFAAVKEENRGGSGAQFIIITHPDFQSAATLLQTHREAQGISTIVVTTTTTGSTASAIKSYIQNAYDNWEIPPEYVLLLGDAEFIPTNYVTPHPYHDDELIGTDLYYSTVDGTDYDADILLGRISVDTLTQATNHINRIIAYPVAGSHYDNIALAAYFQDYDNYDGYEDRRFVLTSEEIRDYMLTQSYDVERIYYTDSNVTPTHWSTTYGDGSAIPTELLRSSGFAWDGDSGDITSAVNDGVLILTHRDHGAIWGWGDPYYTYSNVNGLTNGDKQPVVFSMNCQTGWFDNETDYNSGTTSSTNVFSEAWERNPNGGAVGIIAATRVTYSGYNDYMILGIYDAFWPDFLTYNNTSFDRPEYRVSAALNYGKLAMRALWGEWIIEAEMFHYFGDPTMLLGQFEPPPEYKSFLPLMIGGSGSAGCFNGDFELGHVGWTEYSSSGNDLITNSMPVTPHSGSWLAKFGENDNETDQLSQSVFVPADQTELHFWYWIPSADPDLGWDYFRVKINGATIRTINLYDDNITSGWVEEVVDLSSHAGSFVTLMFEVTNDVIYESVLYLDDVSFEASFNGDFELGHASWTEYSSSANDLITSSMPVTPLSGSWLAQFGENNYETDQLSQAVTVPVGSPYLHYFYWIDSVDICGYDYFRVKIDGGAHQILDLCSSQNTGGWVEGSYDLSAYEGTSIDLMFEVTTDGSLESNLYLDDVSFSSMYNPGFNSQFNGSVAGWEVHSGYWYNDSNYYYTYGLNDLWSSTSYIGNFSNFDYQVRMWRYGSDSDANNIIIRGTPNPLGTDNRWYNYYSFQYTRNGSFSVWKRLSGGSSTALQGWTSSAAINTGDAWNTLRVVADNSNLYFYINGTLVWSGTDTSFTAGRVGISMFKSNDGYEDDILYLDWAALTPLTETASFEGETVSPEQQLLNEAANQNPVGNIESSE